MFTRKRIVIALGGNALGNTLPEQMVAVKTTAKALCDLIEEGHQVVVVHGNGPQVGMINNAMSALSSVFLIDPEAKIRAILYYPLSTGRNFQEIKRLLAALQVTDKYQVSTPADWLPGEDVVVSAPTTLSEVMNEKNKQDGCDCGTWYFCTKKISEPENKTYGLH